MTIIADIYEKMGTVLEAMKSTYKDGDLFHASEFVAEFRKVFPGDASDMEKRQRETPGSHSLEGYLDGMLYGYCERRSTGDCEGPAIEWLEPKTYRFV